MPSYEPVILTGALSGEVCERAIRIATEVGFAGSPVYDAKGIDTVDDPGHRQSESAWLRPEHDGELFRLVTQIFQQVNNDRYRFSIQGMAPIQILRYSTGSFFREHFDMGLGDAANRKISLIIQLSEADAYAGGEFVVSHRLTLPRERGTACVFPSWFLHRVDEVRSGTRYSLAAWAVGAFFY